MCLQCLLMYLQYKNCAINCDILHFKILVKNGENDISDLLDFKLSWGSMPLSPPPPNVSHHFAPFVFYGSMTYVPCRCTENMKKRTLLSYVYFHKMAKGRLDFPTIKRSEKGSLWQRLGSYGISPIYCIRL